MIAELDEPLDMNFVRKHVLEECAELEAEGMEKTQAWRQASFRILAIRPGHTAQGQELFWRPKLGNSRRSCCGLYALGSTCLWRWFRRQLFTGTLQKENVTNRHHCSKCRSQRIFNVEW